MLAMTTETPDDIVQPLTRAVTKKIETSRHAARPDEQTLRLDSRPVRTETMPRAELIRLISQNYQLRRDDDEG